MRKGHERAEVVGNRSAREVLARGRQGIVPEHPVYGALRRGTTHAALERHARAALGKRHDGEPVVAFQKATAVASAPEARQHEPVLTCGLDRDAPPGRAARPSVAAGVVRVDAEDEDGHRTG